MILIHIFCKFIARNQVHNLLIKPHALHETTKLAALVGTPMFSVMLFFFNGPRLRVVPIGYRYVVMCGANEINAYLGKSLTSPIVC